MLIRVGSFMGAAKGSGEASASLASQLLAAWADSNGGLALDFTDLSARVIDPVTSANNFTGSPNSLLSITASPKWILNSSGVYVQTSANTLATEYDSSGSALGVRIEEARTNSLFHSNDFSQGAWQTGAGAGSSVTKTGNYSVDPFGANSATRLQLVSSGNFAFVQQNISVTSGTARTISVWLKSNTASNYTVKFGDDQIAQPDVTVTPAWQRFTYSYTSASTTAKFQIVVTGSSSVDILASCGMNENGSFATSPIPTTSAAVTRAADTQNGALSLFPSLGSAYFIYCKYRPLSASAENRVIRIDDGTTNELVAIGNTSGGAGAVWITDGGAAQTAPLTTGTITNSAFHRLAVAVEANNVRLVVNGGSQVSDTSVTLPSQTTLRLMPVGNGHIEELMILPRAPTEAEMQAVGA